MHHRSKPQSLSYVPMIAVVLIIVAFMLMLFSCASMQSVDGTSASVETTLSASYRTVGDLRRVDKITEQEKNTYIAKLDAIRTTERISQDAANAQQPNSGQAMAIAQGALAAANFLYAELLAKQAGAKP